MFGFLDKKKKIIMKMKIIIIKSKKIILGRNGGKGVSLRCWRDMKKNCRLRAKFTIYMILSSVLRGVLLRLI